MVAFYVFEGSFFQGGGGWEAIELCTSPEQVRRAAEDYLGEGNWTFSPRSETFEITAYADGAVQGARDLYPHTRIEVPGLTPITFDAEATPAGGVPEPDGRFAQFEVTDSMWDSVDILNTLAEERFHGVAISIDWAAVDVPVLTGPMLTDDAELLIDLETGAHVVIDPDRLEDHDYVVELVGAITALDRTTSKAGEEFLSALPDLDDPDDVADGLTDVLAEAEDCRHLEVGFNSLFE